MRRGWAAAWPRRYRRPGIVASTLSRQVACVEKWTNLAAFGDRDRILANFEGFSGLLDAARAHLNRGEAEMAAVLGDAALGYALAGIPAYSAAPRSSNCSSKWDARRCGRPCRDARGATVPGSAMSCMSRPMSGRLAGTPG